MRKSLLVLLVGLVLLATGCATTSKHMAVTAPTATDMTLAENEAAIVFLRPSNLGAAIQAPIVKVEANNAILFVGIASAQTKILYRTTPGEHTFVVGGESGRKLAATLDGGKFYYVIVDPSMGVFKARFSLIPVTSQNLLEEDFKKKLGKCDWVVPSASANTWFLDNKSNLLEKASIAEEKFMKASPSDREVIVPQYGVARPVTP